MIPDGIIRFDIIVNFPMILLEKCDLNVNS